ncbi:tRNA lysidine(34) synthetase TilS [Ornithinibacillus scapharcae]|uniref:tRNA lysidine(34) synthetase TilS n=1 Tax=Ornithinibacillus scapharcae TaxID=1147159 RepID=UPI000225AAA6|nr:tRNA lysidine(34) synthetase TilS [Ornithinibacillus scapharcae]
MKEEVTDFIQKHQLLAAGKTVLVAVSGGPDSMALLHYFKSIREQWQLRVIALSVDHQLRGIESKEDLLYVEGICNEWGIEFIGTSINVNEFKKREQLGTQVAARVLRYQFFEEQMRRLQADYLAFGHHGDDQIETMLMKFTRSGDPGSITGIPVKRAFAGGQIIRPFLCLTKQAIEDYCKRNGINPRLDPSNNSIDYTRNFFRKQIVPLLKAKNSSLHRTMQHLHESLEADKEFIQMEGEKMFQEVVHLEENPKKVMFDIDVFKSRASALQRSTFHLILNYLYGDLPKDLSYVHEDQFFSLMASQKSNTQIDFPRHLKVLKAYNKLIFYFYHEEPVLSDFHDVIPIPGEISLPNGSKLIATYIDHVPGQNENTYICLENNITLPLHIRFRREGDRMSWKGLNGSKKLKDIFMDAKIPLHERNRWPVVTDNNGEIIWLVGLKKRDSIPRQDKSLYIQLYYEKGIL